jgi:hypothetical protein
MARTTLKQEILAEFLGLYSDRFGVGSGSAGGPQRRSERQLFSSTWHGVWQWSWGFTLLVSPVPI